MTLEEQDRKDPEECEGGVCSAPDGDPVSVTECDKHHARRQAELRWAEEDRA